MKILYLEHPEPDYGTSQLYLGLVQLLGDENVIDFPYKYCSHGKIEQLQNVDVKEFMCDNPTVFPDGGYSDPFSWAIPSKGAEYHYDEIKEKLRNGEFDLILMTTRSVSIYFLKRLLHDLNLNIPPVILCDFEDYANIRFDIYAAFAPHVKMITKSSYLPDMPGNREHLRKGNEKIYPLLMSSPLIDNPAFRFDDSEESKTFDVHARFGLTRSLRKEVIESLRKIDGFKGGIALPERSRSTMIIENGVHLCGNGGRTIITSLDEHVPYKQYLQEITHSKISVAMGGHGLTGIPARAWEIPSYNTLMLCEPHHVLYEHPFEDGKTCVFFNPEIKDDVYEKALYWLSDEMENERREIAKAGHEHLKKYHTCHARAARLIEVCKEEEII